MNPPNSPPRDWHSEPEPANETIEIGQPDPVLQETRAGPLRVTIYALGGIAIAGLVLYGLNRPHLQNEINAQQTAAAPPQQPAPSQDEATKGGGPSGQTGGQPTKTTTGAAPQDGNKQQGQSGASNQAKPNPQGGAPK
jgi:hypothetical protein